MRRTFNLTIKTLIIAAVSLAASCCEIDIPIVKPGPEPGKTDPEKVMLLYSAGFNSIRNYLLEDIQDLKGGWLPDEEDGNILLVYTHSTTRGGGYSTPSSPYLIRLYKDSTGLAVSDTLITYERGTVSSSAVQLNKVLQQVKEAYPVKSYGMIFSSHATGFLPAGYYSNPSGYRFEETKTRALGMFRDPVPVPYIEPEHDPSLPMVKSIGQDQVGMVGDYTSYEMDLRDFAEAIPMKLDYILFDACLMGGAEVAYELKGKCGKVGFSQAEVLAEGLDYKTLTKHLLKNDEPDPKAVCKDYFTQYDIQSGVYKSATVSLIDCDKTDNLADVCRDIFAARRDGLAAIDPSEVQRFYRAGKHWFYDLESIVIEAGATESELALLHSALDECVIYKGHTPKFMEEITINIFSGLSMYLPCHGSEELDKYYRTLKWNQATGLVE